MSDLSTHYERMYRDASASIAAGRYTLDQMIDDPGDNRFGISLIIKLSDELCDKIIALQNQFKSIEPEQYYYPRTDLHITVIAIVSCHSGLTIEDRNMIPYFEILQRVIHAVPPFQITCSGLTASAGSVLMQGFPSGKEIDQFRNEIRTRFNSSGLFHTIDTRYPITAAHSTIIRFRHALRSPAAMVSKLDSLRDFSFGILEVDRVQLVYNDWYQRADRTRLLKKFRFNKPNPK